MDRSSTRLVIPKTVAIGDRFGRLLVVAHAESQSNKARLKCKCDCGAFTIARACHLRSGRVRSCGCLRVETSRRLATKHGLSRMVPEHGVWMRLIRRCEDPNNKSYSRYGGRGIVVCDRWRADFAAFFADMGHRPSPKHSIDRIDNNGNYQPGNCRWATATEQSRNRRSTVMLRYQGEVACLREWSQRLDIAETSMRRKVRAGWSLERIASERTLRTERG